MAGDEITAVCATPEATRAVAAAVATLLRPGDVVALSGDLGAGKTCFVQGAAEALGVRARVQSPSFVIVREYHGDIPIRHVDVYRLNSIQELIDLGYDELFDPARVLFIEWGDAVEGELPGDRLEIEITGTGTEERRIALRGRGTWEQRIAGLPSEVAP